jgi:hypothetical protein
MGIKVLQRGEHGGRMQTYRGDGNPLERRCLYLQLRLILRPNGEK